MTVVWSILALIVLVALLPIILEMMRAEPDEDEAPGKFADLASGRTHYQWLGPVRGPVVVAVHGLTTPSPIWDDIAEGLGETAYRVLVYDLYGRGFSKATPGRQGPAYFVRQLEELLAHLDVQEDVTLLGYSMGGAISTAYAARHPEQMQRVILLAPSGIEAFENVARWQLGPWIGGWWARVVAPFRGRAAVREAGVIGAVQRREFRRRGFNPSVLSSRRGILAQTFEQEHRKIANDGIPVMAIWGEKDDVIPMRGVGTLAEWNRDARQEVIDGAGHGLVFTHGFDVVALLREMLRD